MAEKPIQKIRSGMVYSAKEKQIIVNVYKYFRKLYPDKSVSQIVTCTSKATGSSERSIYMFRKEDASTEGLKEPSRKRLRKKVIWKNGFDNSTKEAVRNVICTLEQNKIPTSFRFISQMIKEIPQLPNLGDTTLRKVLASMGFVYKKVHGQSILVEESKSCEETFNDETVWINNGKSIIEESHTENLINETDQMPVFIKCENVEQCSDIEFYNEEESSDTELNNDMHWNNIEKEQNITLKFECEDPWSDDSAINNCDHTYV